MMVNNMRDLLRHITLHRRRVYVLATHLQLLHNYNIRPIERIYYRLHDVEKYLFLPLLWVYYGGKGNRSHADKVYKLMNFVGVLLSGWCLVDDITKDFERVADVVDRHMDPVALEEFNITKEDQPPIGHFLNIFQFISIFQNELVRDYSILTQHLSYGASK